MDHNVPTLNRMKKIEDELSAKHMETLEDNCKLTISNPVNVVPPHQTVISKGAKAA